MDRPLASFREALSILEQIPFETLHSVWSAKVNFTYALCADSPSDVGLS